MIDNPLTFKQQEYVCDKVNEWYLEWKSKMTNHGAPHALGIAKEQLKDMLCGLPINKTLENIFLQETN